MITPEILRRLAEIWGADLRRWPAAERSDAQAYLSSHDLAGDLLARAAELDRLLDAHAVAQPSAALVRAVLAGAPPPAARRSKRTRRRGLHMGGWWFGLSAAGAGAAGAVVGAMVVGMALSMLAPAAPHRSMGLDRTTLSCDSEVSVEWTDE